MEGFREKGAVTTVSVVGVSKGVPWGGETWLLVRFVTTHWHLLLSVPRPFLGTKPQLEMPPAI